MRDAVDTGRQSLHIGPQEPLMLGVVMLHIFSAIGLGASLLSQAAQNDNVLFIDWQDDWVDSRNVGIRIQGLGYLPDILLQIIY